MQDRTAEANFHQDELQKDSSGSVLWMSDEWLRVTHTQLKIVFSSSYTGSPQQIVELYQDVESIVRKYSKSDLFITFTFNPKWEEIMSALLLNQKTSDRSDLS